jgi:hypothetical protein
VITFASIPKAFDGHSDVIQSNAIASWLRVAPDVEVLLIGNDAGVADAARQLGARHLPEIARNDFGTPLVDDALRLLREMARNDLLCYVNADVLLPASLATAARRTQAQSDRFLVVGECWNAHVDIPIEPTDAELERLFVRAKKRGSDALDYFLYTCGVFDDVPPFAVGRTAWDNWLVWKARSEGALVADVTWVVKAIHQDHSYSHVGSLPKLRRSPEADENRRLAGDGRARLYSRLDATHRLTPWGLVPNPAGVGHSGETLRRAWAKLGSKAGVRRT